MGTKLKNYNKEFKDRAIKFALTSSQPISKTAKKLGMNEATLYSWVKSNRDAYVKQHRGTGKEVLDELAKLREENARLREEREILKKAAAFFAKEAH